MPFPRPLSNTVIAAVAVAGLTLIGAVPAFAVYAPLGTATIVAVSVTEGAGEIEGFCPDGTVGVEVQTTTPGVTVLPGLVWYGADPAPENEGRYAVPFSSSSLAGPGSTALFTVGCFDATETLIGSASTTAVIHDSGATIVAPASALAGEDIVVTGTCPADTERIDAAAELPGISTAGPISQAQGEGAWSLTWTSADFAPVTPVAGDSVEVYAYCVLDTDSVVLSFRNAFVTITAPAAVDPPSASADQLAAAGMSDAVVSGLLIGGIALLALGALALRLRRRLG